MGAEAVFFVTALFLSGFIVFFAAAFLGEADFFTGLAAFGLIFLSGFFSCFLAFAGLAGFLAAFFFPEGFVAFFPPEGEAFFTGFFFPEFADNTFFFLDIL